jgi:hypothetical protein
MRRSPACLLALLSMLLLASCGGGSSSSGLNVFMADAPIDSALDVVITVTGIHVTGTNGTTNFVFPSPSPIDLFQDGQGGTSVFLLSGAHLDAGNYQSISLDIDAKQGTSDSYIVLATDKATTPVHPLYIPTGDPTTLSAPINFTMQKNGTMGITVDFDLRASVIQDPANPDNYILRPKIRAVDNTKYGSISGIVNQSLLTTGCTPAVYMYSGAVTPGDVNINATSGEVQPITSALLSLNSTTVKYNFAASFLPPGAYTVAFTCQAGNDHPDQADNITFNPVTTTTVTAGGNAVVILQ